MNVDGGDLLDILPLASHFSISFLFWLDFAKFIPFLRKFHFPLFEIPFFAKCKLTGKEINWTLMPKKDDREWEGGNHPFCVLDYSIGAMPNISIPGIFPSKRICPNQKSSIFSSLCPFVTLANIFAIWPLKECQRTNSQSIPFPPYFKSQFGFLPCPFIFNCFVFPHLFIPSKKINIAIHFGFIQND